jgi:hypothetical protein
VQIEVVPEDGSPSFTHEIPEWDSFSSAKRLGIIKRLTRPPTNIIQYENPVISGAPALQPAPAPVAVVATIG